MNKTEVKLQYELCENQTDGITALIAAAGSSSRMRGKDKQLLKICGIPVIARTLLRFEASKAVKRIILVVKSESVFEMQLLAEKYMITKLSDIVCGGENRQDSVLKGLARLDEDDKYLLIHDGARPLADERIIASVAKALKTHPAVTCAVKLKDTVKQVDESGRVIKTLPRESLVAVQTPQGVWVKEYLEAVKSCGDLARFTDDASIMEAAGFEVFTVEGSYKNIKITTPEDIITAEGYVGEVEECE